MSGLDNGNPNLFSDYIDTTKLGVEFSRMVTVTPMMIPGRDTLIRRGVPAKGSKMPAVLAM